MEGGPPRPAATVSVVVGGELFHDGHNDQQTGPEAAQVKERLVLRCARIGSAGLPALTGEPPPLSPPFRHGGRQKREGDHSARIKPPTTISRGGIPTSGSDG